MSRPYVGDDVLYRPDQNGGNPSQPWAAKIAKVHERKEGEPQRVNLAAFDAGGHHRAIQNVVLLDFGSDQSGSGFAVWPQRSEPAPVTIEQATGQSAADFVDGKPKESTPAAST